MASVNRWSPFDDVFNFHREVERVFNQFWNDLPARTAESLNSFRVNTTEDGWHTAKRSDTVVRGPFAVSISMMCCGSSYLTCDSPSNCGCAGSGRICGSLASVPATASGDAATLSRTKKSSTPIGDLSHGNSGQS